MTLVLDAGALIAVDRGDRAMWARLKAAHQAGHVPVTHGGIVGQVWRSGSRQAQLAQTLRGIDVRPLDDALGRSAGQLLAATGATDVIDAALARLAEDGDDVLTSDAGDIAALLAATGRHVEVISV